MLLYKRLYTGEGAEKRRSQVFPKIRKGTPPSGVYVIVPPPEGTKNLLEIYPAGQILGKNEARFRRVRDREPLILGIAWGYSEALTLAGQMVDEIYRATGGFDFDSYLNLSEYAVWDRCDIKKDSAVQDSPPEAER